MEFLAGTACIDPEVRVKGQGHAVIKCAANVCTLVSFCFSYVFYTFQMAIAVVVCPSVCPCVCFCVSVTLRYCIKSAKRTCRITQIMPYDSALTLVV